MINDFGDRSTPRLTARSEQLTARAEDVRDQAQTANDDLRETVEAGATDVRKRTTDTVGFVRELVNRSFQRPAMRVPVPTGETWSHRPVCLHARTRIFPTPRTLWTCQTFVELIITIVSWVFVVMAIVGLVDAARYPRSASPSSARSRKWAGWRC